MDSDIKTYSLGVMSSDIYENITSLAIANVKQGTLPYVKSLPLPQDMNIVNGRHLGDINKIQLELKAAKIGAKSLKWIYGADAELLQLELKDTDPVEFQAASQQVSKGNFDCEPVVVLANTRRNISKSTLNISHESDIAAEGMQMDAQCVYLLDQFTDKSIQKALKPQNIEKRLEMYGDPLVKRQVKAISQNMITYMNEYDSGLREQGHRKLMRDNIVSNLTTANKDGSVNKANKEMSEVYKGLKDQFDDSQKTVFKALNKYYTKQNTGLDIKRIETDKEVEDSVLKLASLNNFKLAETLSEAYFFTDRSTHYGFSFDRVYTESEQVAKDKVLAPQAARFMPKEKEVQRLMDQKEREKLREREREFKPRSMERERGRF